MTRKPVLVAVLSCALLAACSGSTSGTGSTAAGDGGPSVARLSPTPTAPVSLDGGAIVIEPLATTLPNGSRVVAARVLAGAQVGAGPQTAVAAHVRVEVSPPSVASAAYGGLERLDLPRAWVYVVHEVPASGLSCTMTTGGGHFGPSVSPTPVPSNASGDYAVIVDAATGRGYVYSGAGTGPCTPSAVPGLRAVLLSLSVPYRVHRFTPRSSRLTVTVPPCADYSGFTPSYAVAGGHEGAATVTMPAAPCTGHVARVVVQSISGRFVESPHSAPGLVCGEAYDGQLGRPADCVA